jgi:membrane protease YdiL (CAAX protease family)
MQLKRFIQQHPTASFFTFAYAFTWGSILLFLASRGFRTDSLGLGDGLLIFFLMALGPATAGLVLTALLEGRRGLAVLSGGMRTWRVGIGWYAVALLTVPGLTLLLLGVLNVAVSGAFVPAFFLPGIVIGLLAGFLEELGWTGFALPRLLNKYTALMAGLGLGVLWAVWHMLADYVGNINSMSGSWLGHFLVYWVLGLVAYRVLMTWVYVNTKSLLVAQLMHASYTGWQVVLSPAVSFEQTMLWQTLFVGSLWVIVAVVVVLYGAGFVRHKRPISMQVA